MKFDISVDHLNCAHWRMDIGKVNAFSKEAVEAMDDLLSYCVSRFPDEIRVLSIESDKISPNHKPIFSAGADQKERENWSCEAILSHVNHQREVIHRFREVPFWIVCCVDGIALGLGVEMCLAADFVLASPNARFGFPEKRLGIIPGAGGYTWAHHLAKDLDYAKRIIETGEWIDADHAEYVGIVDSCCDSEDFSDEVSALAFQLLGMSSEDQVMHKKKRLEKIDFKFEFEKEQSIYAEALQKSLHR